MKQNKLSCAGFGAFIRVLSAAAAVVVLTAALTGCSLFNIPGGVTDGGNTDPIKSASSNIKEEIEVNSEKMPDLTGLKKEDAVKMLAEMGVTAKLSEMETDKEKDGCVFSHVPTAGKPIKAGDEATLYIAKQKATEKKETKTSSKASSKASEKKDTGKKTGSTTYLYCIAADYVSLRAKPNVNSKELIKIPSGDGMIYMNDKSGSWYYVKYGDYYGYVYEDYVSFNQNSNINYKPDNTGGNNSSDSYTLYCTASDFVSLRAAADVNSREILRIPRGNSMAYLGTKSGNWYFVQYNGKRGFVYGDYVSTSKPGGSYSPKTYTDDYLYCTASDFVALRSDPDVNSTELRRIPHGYRMDYLGSKSGHWYFVQYGDLKGYVYDKYVTFDKNAVN